MVRRMMVCGVFGALVALGQTRTETYQAADVAVNDARLLVLPDGGCAAMWCGQVQSAAGDVTRTGCTNYIELTQAANRNACASVLAVGTPRVLRALNFAVDGGRQ